ncbi:unnamed protein product [Symbiodinium natans]|uniref:Uncharacterized protein n=1 Tax=Symbiodinium natans TaxID=878477 RepID=A0A812PP41_9DINO|nr:unnamed protein product [Symbiodinium natans]
MARPAALLRAAVLACALLALKDLAFVAPADSPKPRGAEVLTSRPAPVAHQEATAKVREDAPKALMAFASAFTPTSVMAYYTADEALRPWTNVAPWYGGALYVLTLVVQRVKFEWYNYVYVAAAALWLGPAFFLFLSYKWDPTNQIEDL